MNLINRILGRAQPKENAEGMIHYKPIYSNEPGRFTVFIDSRVVDFLHEAVGLKFSDLEKLPEVVYQKCIELGFEHGSDTHLLVELDHSRNAQASMKIGKFQIPMPVGNVLVTHSVIIYADEIIFELKKLQSEIMFLMPKNFKPTNIDLARAGREKVLMGISHEFVHMFATDEHSSLMPSLGLELLELLTDSINFDLHFMNYEKESSVVQFGFADGIAYLTNLVRRKHGIKDPAIHLKFMKEQSKEIIHDCNYRLNGNGNHL
jgi:hypothetical protein